MNQEKYCSLINDFHIINTKMNSHLKQINNTASTATLILSKRTYQIALVIILKLNVLKQRVSIRKHWSTSIYWSIAHIPRPETDYRYFWRMCSLTRCAIYIHFCLFPHPPRTTLFFFFTQRWWFCRCGDALFIRSPRPPNHQYIYTTHEYDQQTL